MHYDFKPVSVDRFCVLGIAKAAELEPNDTTAFITELTFTGTGRFTGTKTPIVVFFSDSGSQLVSIYIEPGSYPNCFNINGPGVIPVAIPPCGYFRI